MREGFLVEISFIESFSLERAVKFVGMGLELGNWKLVGLLTCFLVHLAGFEGVS